MEREPIPGFVEVEIAPGVKLDLPEKAARERAEEARRRDLMMKLAA